ncbi:MAG TPA: hypothetical protein VIL74_23175 [Pyrinomonadaceae bacterium]|jgi:hypothetical protein
MKFINAFFIAALFFTVSIFGQSKNVLADGNPPLTQTMVNRLTTLMQWSLDADFNDDERSRLRAAVVDYWRNGDEKSINSILNTLAFEQKLASASEEQKRNLQPQVQGKLVEEFEKEPNEPLNKVLLAAFRRTHASDVSLIDAQNGEAPGILVGRWQVRHANSLTTQNAYTGALGDGNGMIAEYDIKADGSVIFSFFLTQNNYGCVTKIKTSKTGRVAVGGLRAVFSYDRGTTTSSDNCNKQNNYTKSLGATTETLDFTIKTEAAKKQFCFSDGKLKDCAVKLD